MLFYKVEILGNVFGNFFKKKKQLYNSDLCHLFQDTRCLGIDSSL